ncbi:hypothetical protein PFISCL1PPCAC_9957 [Pristionchus fissidentatus]|uniref:Phosphodiesterase n=1 Tax=Pristionchus fissidentatus TaxID=1538716 RepID=A0AAV5VL30_9BILA|nr:hypothetical protein PFISCL1PPCAC_9957 [Pristionchus fissidentatus]
MSVTAHMRRNSSPHVHSNAIVRVNTPPRKISQPARLRTNNNESSEDEGENGGTTRRIGEINQLSSSHLISSCSSCSSFNHSEEGVGGGGGGGVPSSSLSSPPSLLLLPSLTPSAHLIYEKLMHRCPVMDVIVESFTRDLLNLCHAEACSMFLIDPITRELVAEIPKADGRMAEIRLPSGRGIVGRVASTKTIMNVRDVERNPYFYRQVDELTGFRTRTILCMPLCGAHGEVLGVVSLCNRRGRSHFSRHDQLAASACAVHFETSLSHCLLSGTVAETGRRSHMATEFAAHGSHLLVNPDDIRRLSCAPVPATSHFSPHFNSFHFIPRSIGGGDQYIEASIAIFNELGFINRYRIERKKLAGFVLRVAQGYRNVPYHNWSHAFAVAHFAFLLLRTPAVRVQLDELERLSLVIACLCHDIDHRGTTNSFQKQARTPLAQLYSSEGSVLERHHYQQTINILSEVECDILSNLTGNQHKAVYDHIKDIILATDIAQHMTKVGEMRQMITQGINPSLERHHFMMVCMLMTASDLSDQTKHFKSSKGIAENIYTEFFSQGDLEKQMGASPVEMMDRERACVPRVQIDFIDTVALPVFDMLSSAVPESLPTFHSLLHNRRCWAILEELFKERGVTSNGLDCLSDPQLEEEVLSRMRKSDSRVETERFLSSIDWTPLCPSKLDHL